MNLKKLFFASALLFAACGTIQAQEVNAHRGSGLQTVRLRTPLPHL